MRYPGENEFVKLNLFMMMADQGMLRGRGQRLLFADADGATQFSDLEKLEKELNSNSDVNIV